MSFRASRSREMAAAPQRWRHRSCRPGPSRGRDYIGKNDFPGVLISGGIDSALTLAIAVDALGADKVRR